MVKFIQIFMAVFTAIVASCAVITSFVMNKRVLRWLMKKSMKNTVEVIEDVSEVMI